MRIDEGVKREILSRIDIGEYIGAVVSLRKVNNDLVGLCPFHGEKTPSFRVHPDRMKLADVVVPFRPRFADLTR